MKIWNAEHNQQGGFLYVKAINCYVCAIGNEYLIYPGNRAIYLPAGYNGGIGMESEETGFIIFTIQ